jgi:hypothetical protein
MPFLNISEFKIQIIFFFFFLKKKKSELLSVRELNPGHLMDSETYYLCTNTNTWKNK